MMVDNNLIANSSGHSASSRNMNPVTLASGRESKRIPASLMKMRRESLANTGKYKLQSIDVGILPDNSLIGMTSNGKRYAGVGSLATTYHQDLSSTVSALVTPKRLTTKSMMETLEQASSNAVADNNGGLTNSSYHKLVSKLQPIENDLDGNPSDHTAATSQSGSSPSLRRRMARRTKSADGTANAFISPRRAARKSMAVVSSRLGKEAELTPDRNDMLTTPSPKSSQSLQNDPTNDAPNFARDNSASATKNAPPTAANNDSRWMCTCGEENEGLCNFCGMCGTRQRWECHNCNFANKCKFVFCGMCGIPKKNASQ